MGISPNGQYVCGYYQCIINTAAFVYDTQTRQFITIPLGPGFYDAIANDVNDAGVTFRIVFRWWYCDDLDSVHGGSAHAVQHLNDSLGG